MNKKKETKSKNGKASSTATVNRVIGEIANESDLRAFLLNVKDKMVEEVAAPVFVATMINNILSNPNIFSLLNNENKEIARDIWLRVKQSGFQVKSPPMLFGYEEANIAE
jgi:hypothetical protein